MEELERGEDRLLPAMCGCDARRRLIFQVLGRAVRASQEVADAVLDKLRVFGQVGEVAPARRRRLGRPTRHSTPGHFARALHQGTSREDTSSGSVLMSARRPVARPRGARRGPAAPRPRENVSQTASRLASLLRARRYMHSMTSFALTPRHNEFLLCSQHSHVPCAGAAGVTLLLAPS